MKPSYEFKAGSRLSGDAQAVGERLDAIRRRRAGLTPAAVVAEARSERSVLHPYFEWDDARAAELHRLNQAGHVIRCVVVVIDEPDAAQGELLDVEQRASVTVRAFVSVQRRDGDRVFESTAVALSDGEYRRQVLEQAHAELSAVAKRYRELSELAEVVGAIDRVGELLSTTTAAE